MKILGINGSARKQGNTAKLVKKILAGAKVVGHEVSYIDVAGLNIEPCLACRYCRNHVGECITKDGMEAVCQQMLSADILVIGSPIYFATMTGNLKVLLDRVFFSKNLPAAPFAGKKVIVAYTQHQEDIARFESYFALMERSLYGYMQMPVIASIVVGSTGEIDDILRQPAALEEAQLIGKSL
ncbi:MAG: flavodoxin family protein [Clostridia bacterium]